MAGLILNPVFAQLVVRRCACSSLLILLSAVSVGCASTEELFAEYDEQFCPATHANGKAKTNAPSVTNNTVAARQPASARKEPVVAAALPRNIESTAGTQAQQNRKGALAGTAEAMLLSSVFFASDSDQITGRARETLAAAAIEIKQQTRRYVLVRGHSDSHAVGAYDRQLSERRANAAVKFLRQAGVDHDRIRIATGDELRIRVVGIADRYAQDNRRVDLIWIDSKRLAIGVD